MSEEATATPRPLRANTAGAAALGLLSAAGLIVLFELRDPTKLLAELSVGQAQLHANVAHLGILAPILFIAAYASLMLLVWVPSWPFAVIGGLLFGLLPAALYSLAATTLGAIGVFVLARAGLAQRISRNSAFFRRLDAGFRRDAFEYIIALRIMPVMPFGIIHVAAAMFNISLTVFTVGTAIGMIPCVLIYAWLGTDLDRFASGGRRLDVASLLTPSVIGPLFALAALALVPILVRRFRSRRTNA